jgi:acetoin utilization protein AcuB
MQRMTANPITITPHTTHREALKLMRDNHIRRLPVMAHGRLVGIVCEKDLLSTAPSPVTSLSVYEIYSLLDKLTIDQIMSKPVFAVDEITSIATAARLMIERKIGCLPVVRGEELVGIITETDIFKSFVEVLGGDEPGLRVDLSVTDKRGMLADLTKAIANAGANIVSLTTFHGVDAEHMEISIKERGADIEKIESALDIQGVQILDIRPGGQDGLLQFG